MSSSVFARRAARALAIAVVLLLGAGAQAASAATVFVDDDHAQCPFAGFRAISPALARVPAGSTIFVCPGTYVEQLHMTTPGVSVVGLTGVSADVVLRPPDPAVAPFAPDAMVEMSAPATRLSGITLQGPAPPAVFGCGPFIGVLVRNGPGPFSGASVIANVRLRQIGRTGCPGFPRFVNRSVGVQIGDSAGGAMSGRATVRNSSYMGDQSAIAVNPDSRADIRDNVLGHPFRQGPPGSQPFGIRAVGSVVNIARNEISGFELLDDEDEQLGFGIQLVGVSGTVGGPGAGNIVRDNATGVWLFSTSGVTVSHNLVLRSFFEGILADDLSTGNLFLNNVSKFNARDCVDQSGANRWSGNIGSQPVSPGQKAICPLPRR